MLRCIEATLENRLIDTAINEKDLMVFKSKRRLRNHKLPRLYNTVLVAQSVKYLGVTLDRTLPITQLIKNKEKA